MSDTKLADAIVELQLRDSKFNQAMREKAASIASGMRSLSMASSVAVGTLAVKGLDLAASGMSAMVKSGFDYNSAIERSTTSFTVLLGSQARAVSLMDQLRTFAAKTPFDLPGINKAAVSLLATKKVGQSQVLPMLQKLGDAAAGSSEGFASMPRITRAISQMLTKGKIQAEEMMQLSEAGVPAWSALATQMGKSTAEVQKMGEQGKLRTREIMMLVEGLGKTYEGLADKQSKTFEGMSSTIKDNMGKAFGDTMKPLFELSKKGMARLIALMDSPKFEQFTATIASGVQKAIDLFTRLVNSPITQAVAKFAAMAAGGMAVVGTIALIGAGVAKLFAAAPIIAFGAALGGIATLFQRAFAGPEGPMFVGMLKESWILLKEIGLNLSDNLMPLFRSIGEVLGVTFSSGGTLQQGFNSFLKIALGGLKSMIDFVSILTVDFSKTWELGKTAAEFAVNYIQDRFLFFFNTTLPFAVAGAFDGILAAGSMLVDKWRTLFEAMFESVGMLINGMIDASKARIDGVVAALAAVKSGRLGDAMTEIAKGEKNAQGILGRSKIDAAKNFFSKSSPILAESGAAFAKAFRDTMKAAPEFKSSARTSELETTMRRQFDEMRAARDRKRMERWDSAKSFGSALQGISGGVGGVGGAIADALKAGGQTAIETKGPLADTIGAVKKFGDGMGMFFGQVDAMPKKDRKTEFVGLTEMNKRIQQQLSNKNAEADRKKSLKIAEDTKKLTEQVATATTQAADTLGGILKRIGMTE